MPQATTSFPAPCDFLETAADKCYGGTRPPHPTCHEAPAWEAVHPGWRQIYGNFFHLGVSIEEHDFRSPRPINWSRSFHDESVEICLNRSGHGSIAAPGRRMEFSERTAGHYVIRGKHPDAERVAGHRHRFITIELSRAFLARHLRTSKASLHPSVRALIEGEPAENFTTEIRPLTGALETLTLNLGHPPVPPDARPLWFESKTLELIAQFLFVPQPGGELFCARQKRLASERAHEVMLILRDQFQTPPTLEELGRRVGCSPFYLSRIFSEEAGMTIQQYLRQARMERAAELLLSGGYNVTEAAFAVGYSSLGHFSKAFCEVIGCCPALFPHAKVLRSARRRQEMAKLGKRRRAPRANVDA